MATIGVILIVGVVFGVVSLRSGPPQSIHIEAEALNHVDLDQAAPVTDEIISFNSARTTAGLRQVGTTWFMAPTSLLIYDFPAMTVLLDEHRIPSALILESGELRSGFIPRYSEFEVVGRKLSGKAATWLGSPRVLFTVETYRDNQLNGPATCFSVKGDTICRCEFVDGRPWTGRTLERRDFDHTTWDVSYKDGRLHGPEMQFTDEGGPEQLRSFKDGVLHGPERQYHQGVLCSETTMYEGREVRHRSWFSNGRLEWDETYVKGHSRTGFRKRWDENGVLTLEENYVNDGYHARRWEQGHEEHWWWHGTSLGNGARGKSEFDARSAAAK